MLYAYYRMSRSNKFYVVKYLWICECTKDRYSRFFDVKINIHPEESDEKRY